MRTEPNLKTVKELTNKHPYGVEFVNKFIWKTNLCDEALKDIELINVNRAIADKEIDDKDTTKSIDKVDAYSFVDNVNGYKFHWIFD